MRRIASAIFSDFYWKLLAGAMAFLLWFIGTYMFNPIQNSSFTIQLEHHNIEILTTENLYLLNPEALDVLVLVGVRAPRHDLDILGDATPARRAEMVIPSVDFRAIDVAAIIAGNGPQTVRLDVSMNMYAGYEHIFIRPSFIEVELDVITTEVFAVDIDGVGEVDSGLELRAIRLANNAVTVTGTRTNIARIDRVQVSVDIWGINYVAELPNLRLDVLDTDGNIITDYFQLSVTETTAAVSVWPIETLSLEIEVTGYVAPGFAVEGHDFEPRQISVTGVPADLDDLDYFVVSLDLGGRSESFIEQIDISASLPAGVFLANDQSPYVSVGVEIEPIIERVFHVLQDDIRVFGMGVIYDVLSDAQTIGVRVMGSRTQLELMRSGDIVLELDLRNRAIGIHTVTLLVGLPDGMALAQPNAPTLRVQIHEPADIDDEYDEYYEEYDLDYYDENDHSEYDDYYEYDHFYYDNDYDYDYDYYDARP